MKSRIFIFIVLCRLLNAQDNPMALLDAGERALTNGNYVLAGQQMDRALLSAGNVVLPSSDLRRVLLGFALLGFTSVYREGFEVVLFL